MRPPYLLRSAQVRTYKTIRTPAPATRIAPDDPLGIGVDDLPPAAAVEREQDKRTTWRLLDLADDLDSASRLLRNKHHARIREAVGQRDSVAGASRPDDREAQR